MRTTPRVGVTPRACSSRSTPALTSASTRSWTGLPERITRPRAGGGCPRRGRSRARSRSRGRAPQPGQDLVGLAERAVDRGHEDAAHEVEHGHAVRAGLHGHVADARRAGREVGRTQEQVLLRDVLHDLLLVPDVVARGQHVGALLEHLLGHRPRHAEAAGGVLAVHHAEVDRVLLAQARQVLRQRGAPGLAEDVADHQDVHGHYLATSTARVSRITTTLMWPGYCISASMRLEMSFASWCASRSETTSARVMTRSSRPAWIA